ncbi:Armadillo-like helical domain containing protein [Gracilaria domingensis]|nr:Armadillo-like helical domain containing protein [Gracilaria domingensis]
MEFRESPKVLVAFIILLLFTHTLASTAAVLSSASDESSTESLQCKAGEKEDQVLCEASKVKQSSIDQVIEEDEASRGPPETPSAERDPWAAAYEQWIVGKNPTGRAKAVNRALEEAMKRYPDAKKPEDSKEDFELQEADDDELTVITAAVQNISASDATAERLTTALDTIEELCNSGDNGRQMQAAGGVPHLLRHASSVSTHISLLSVRALATCAQNNPTVFDSAVDEGAISFMLRLADNSNDALRAASLRVLVAIADSTKAEEALEKEESEIVRVVHDSLRKESGTDGTRCQIRAFALVEQCLVRYRDTWKQKFVSSGLVKVAEHALRSESVDVREGAARVLRMLR